MDKTQEDKQDDDSPERQQQPEEIDEPTAGEPPDANRGMTQLVTVVQAHSLREARTMKSILESAEIPAFLGSEENAVSGADAEAPHGIRILVPEEMAGQAAEILADAAMDDDESLFDDEPDEEFDDQWSDRGEREDYFDDAFEETDDEDDDHYDSLDPFEDDKEF